MPSQQNIAGHRLGAGPQAPPPQSSAGQPKGNAGNRVGARSTPPRRWASQSNADVPGRRPSLPFRLRRLVTRPLRPGDVLTARWLTFSEISGPVLPRGSRWVSALRATSLNQHSWKWDTDESHRSAKAALGWVRHDACTALRLQGQARGAGGQVSPDQQISWFTRHTADDPFVSCPGFNRSLG